MSDAPVSVLLADDQALVRASFSALVDAEDGLRVCAEVADGRAAVAAAREHRPDVVLMDVRMPGMDGLEATAAITADPLLQATRVIVLTTFELDDYVFGALRAGASGFLLKDVEPADLLTAVRVVAAFRAPLVAAKAGVMNLLSIGAAFGVVGLVAQGGWAGQLVGIDTALPVPPFIPVIMFAALFGLSMDYEVFLMSAIRERFGLHGDARRAVVEGVARTARVITAAAAIMVAVFAAFALSPEVFLKLMGIGLATAVLVDATIVRMVLVPAVMQLLGERAWWTPRWLRPRVRRAAAGGSPVSAD